MFPFQSPELFTPLRPDDEDDEDSMGSVASHRDLPPPQASSTPAALRLLLSEANAFMRWPVRGTGRGRGVQQSLHTHV